MIRMIFTSFVSPLDETTTDWSGSTVTPIGRFTPLIFACRRHSSIFLDGST